MCHQGHTQKQWYGFASFHAAFTPTERGGHGIPMIPSQNDSWAHGTHLALSKRPAEELDDLESNLCNFCHAFALLDPYFFQRMKPNCRRFV